MKTLHDVLTEAKKEFEPLVESCFACTVQACTAHRFRAADRLHFLDTFAHKIVEAIRSGVIVEKSKVQNPSTQGGRMWNDGYEVAIQHVLSNLSAFEGKI